MPTPDRFDGPSIEEETQYEDRGPSGDGSGDPTVVGALRRVSNALLFREAGQVAQVLKARHYPTGFDDVDLAGLVNGQVLVYDAASKTFKPGSGASAGDDPDSLFNDLNETYALTYTEVAGVISSVLAHTPGNPVTGKIREVDQITVDSAGLINGMRVRQYGSDGVTVVETLTLSGSTWTKS